MHLSFSYSFTKVYTIQFFQYCFSPCMLHSACVQWRIFVRVEKFIERQKVREFKLIGMETPLNQFADFQTNSTHKHSSLKKKYMPTHPLFITTECSSERMCAVHVQQHFSRCVTYSKRILTKVTSSALWEPLDSSHSTIVYLFDLLR